MPYSKTVTMGSLTLFDDERPVPEKFLPMVNAVLNQLSSQKASNKMKTRQIKKKMATFYLSISDEQTEPTVHVALSGFGTPEESEALAASLATLGNEKITFVPFLPNYQNLEVSIAERLFKAPDDTDCSNKHTAYLSEYREKKKVFLIRWLPTAIQRARLTQDSDAGWDIFCKRFPFLNSEFRKDLQVIDDFMKKLAVKEEHAKFLKTNATGECNEFYPFVLDMAYFASRLEANVNFIAKCVHPFTFESNVLYPRMELLKSYKKALIRVGVSFAALEAAVDKLWERVNKYTVSEITYLMQHCAETNLLFYLQDNKKILQQPGQHYTFSIRVANHEGKCTKMCDLCGMRSLPDLHDLVKVNNDAYHGMQTHGVIPIYPPTEEQVKALASVDSSLLMYGTVPKSAANRQINISVGRAPAAFFSPSSAQAGRSNESDVSPASKDRRCA